MSMVGRRENNQEKQHYRGNKLQFLIHKHGALLPEVINENPTGVYPLDSLPVECASMLPCF